MGIVSPAGLDQLLERDDLSPEEVEMRDSLLETLDGQVDTYTDDMIRRMNGEPIVLANPLPEKPTEESQPTDQATLDAQAAAVVESLATGYEAALAEFEGDTTKFIEALKEADTGISEADMAKIEEAVEASGGDGQKFADEMAQKNQGLMADLAEGLAEMQRKDEQQLRLQAEQQQQADQGQFQIFIALIAAIFGKDNTMLNEVMQQMQDHNGAQNEATAGATTDTPAAEAPSEEASDTTGVAANDADASAEYAQSPDGGALTTNVEKPADPTAAEMSATGEDSLSTTERNVTLADGFGNNASATLEDANVTVVPATVEQQPEAPANDSPEVENTNPGFYDRDIIDTISRKMGF